MRRAFWTAAIILGTAVLAGCSATGGLDAAADAADAAPLATEASPTVVLADGWVKAGEGMTGVFGTLENSGDTPITLESAESSAAGMIELHETATSGTTSTMREIDGGFEIPAGGEYLLEPGGDHIMFMDMPEPLLAGDDVSLTLHFDDGSSLDVSVLVKDYSGAQENYEPGADRDTAHGDHADGEEHGGH